MSEQRQRIYDLLYAETKPKFIVFRIEGKKAFQLKGRVENWTKNEKKAF